MEVLRVSEDGFLSRDGREDHLERVVSLKGTLRAQANGLPVSTDPGRTPCLRRLLRVRVLDKVVADAGSGEQAARMGGIAFQFVA